MGSVLGALAWFIIGCSFGGWFHNRKAVSSAVASAVSDASARAASVSRSGHQVVVVGEHPLPDDYYVNGSSDDDDDDSAYDYDHDRSVSTGRVGRRDRAINASRLRHPGSALDSHGVRVFRDGSEPGA